MFLNSTGEEIQKPIEMSTKKKKRNQAYALNNKDKKAEYDRARYLAIIKKINI